MGGIGAEVRQHLVNLRGITNDARDSFPEVQVDEDVGRQGGADEFHGVGHDLVEPDDDALLLLLPAEGEDLADQIPRANAR